MVRNVSARIVLYNQVSEHHSSIDRVEPPIGPLRGSPDQNQLAGSRLRYTVLSVCPAYLRFIRDRTSSVGNAAQPCVCTAFLLRLHAKASECYCRESARRASTRTFIARRARFSRGNKIRKHRASMDYYRRREQACKGEALL